MKNIINFKNHYTIAFYATLIISVALIIGGFFCPPMGEISGSVLTATGELFLWPTLGLLVKIISEGKKAKFKKGEFEIEVGDNDNIED